MLRTKTVRFMVGAHTLRMDVAEFTDAGAISKVKAIISALARGNSFLSASDFEVDGNDEDDEE